MGLRELFDAYRTTDFRVFNNPPFVLRVGELSKDILLLFKREQFSSAAFLTAWNPHSKSTSKHINEANQARLIQKLETAGILFLEGIGIDPLGAWPGEPSILALGVARKEAVQLGKTFGQNAIIWVGKEGVPELVACREIEAEITSNIKGSDG